MTDPRTLDTPALIALVRRLDEEAYTEPWELDRPPTMGPGHWFKVMANGEAVVPQTRVASGALIAAYRSAAPELARRLEAETARADKAEARLETVYVALRAALGSR